MVTNAILFWNFSVASVQCGCLRRFWVFSSERSRRRPLRHRRDVPPRSLGESKLLKKFRCCVKLLFLVALCLNQLCFVSNHQRCIIIRKTLCGQSFVTIICQCNLWPTSSYRVEKRQVVPDPQPPPQPNSASSSNLNSTSSHPLLIMFSTLWWFLELVFAYLINSKQGIHWKNAVDFDWHWFLLHIDDIMTFLSFRVI